MALKFCNLFYAPGTLNSAGGTQTLDATHEFSSGDTTGLGVSLTVINTDAALVGTYGLDCPTASDREQFAVSAGDIISSSLGSFSFSFRFATFEAGVVMFLASNSGAPTNWIRVFTGATNNDIGFGIRLAGGVDHSINCTAANLQVNTRYSVVCRYDEANSDIAIELYNADGSLRDSASNTTTNFDVPTGIDLLELGVTQNGATFDLHMDNVLIADTYAEPLEDYLDITSYTQYGVAAGTPPSSRLMLLNVG